MEIFEGYEEKNINRPPGWRSLENLFQEVNVSEDPNFKYIIRIANSDVSGEQRLGYALTSIRGIGSRISNAIIQKLKLDSEKLAGELSDKNIEDIEILRFFDLDVKIKMVRLNSNSVAVDTINDVKKAEKLIKKRQSL